MGTLLAVTFLVALPLALLVDVVLSHRPRAPHAAPAAMAGAETVTLSPAPPTAEPV